MGLYRHNGELLYINWSYGAFCVLQKKRSCFRLAWSRTFWG